MILWKEIANLSIFYTGGEFKLLSPVQNFIYGPPQIQAVNGLQRLGGMNMRKSMKELRDEAVQTLAGLIARQEETLTNEDLDMLALAAEDKLNPRTLERVIDRITDSSREDMMDILAESPDSRLLFRDVIKEALDIMDEHKIAKKNYSRHYERSSRRGYDRRSRYEDDDSTDLGTIIDVLDKYMVNNNIPFPSTETAFVALMDRLKGKSNEPDIIAFTGSAKRLYKEMLNARRR